VSAVEVVLRDDPLQAVEESHPAGDVDGEAQGGGRVKDDPGPLVEQVVQRSPRHVLVYDDKVRRRVAAPDHREHVRMREDPETISFHDMATH